ncbi:MAG: phasin family protein [Pseudomonadota bacterium]
MPSFPTNSPMRSGLDAQLGFLTELTRRSYDSLRKLSELNLQFAQQIMQDVTDASRNMLSSSDPFQMTAAAARATQPATEHLRHYQQQLFGILSGTQLELARSAGQLAPQASRYTVAMAESMARDGADQGSATREGAPGRGGNGALHSHH